MAATSTTRTGTSATGKNGHPSYQALDDALNDGTAPTAATSLDSGNLSLCSLNLPAIVGFDPFRSTPTSAATTSSPSMTTSSSTALYLLETGDTSAISVNDIHQGQIGDCFLLSSIGEIALWHSGAITNMITTNPDGTETVTLHLAANGQLPSFGTTSFKSITVTVNNTFPNYAVNNGATQDVVNGIKEIWVQVLEKAVATLEGGYNSIAYGGYPEIAMEELTGQQASWMSPGSLTLQTLQSDMAAGDLIVMDTASSGTLPYNLVNDHAYMFESVSIVNGTPMIQLGNPWGCDQPQAIPLSQLSRGIVEVDVGQFVANSAVLGTSGNDIITLSTPLSNGSVDLGAGNDKLTLANGLNSATIANTETIIGGTGNDAIVLATAANNSSIDLGGGSDKLTFGNYTNVATIANTETIIGGPGADTVTLISALTAGMQIDLGAGANKLTLGAVGNSGTVSNVNTLIGGSGADAITLATALLGVSVDLGAGNDTLTLANGTNSATVSNVEALTGGSGNDMITVGSAAANESINLGAGNDKLTFGNITNTATVANVETITGGSGNDTITLASPLTASMAVDLGAGSNKLTLANAGNTGTVSNVATLFGGTGNDTVTLGSAMVNGSVDLGGGNDTLNLANFTNRVSVANTETVHGGSGNDTIILTGSVAATVIAGGGMNFITGNSAADQFVFDHDSYGNLTTLMNFSTGTGDKIALDTTGSNTLSANTYDLGGKGLILNTDLADVTNAAARMATTLSNGGKGGFVFEQDAGELFYSSNGSFAGGGIQIGVITTNGATPWTFNANSFTQV